jgi:hypothetical protein
MFFEWTYKIKWHSHNGRSMFRKKQLANEKSTMSACEVHSRGTQEENKYVKTKKTLKECP